MSSSSDWRHSIDAVVVAAGAGRRFGGEKLFLPLSGLPILGWSLQALEAAPSVRQVVVVLSDLNVRRGQSLIERLGCRKVVATCIGGERRQDSVTNGLRVLSGATWVAIHDGARPFLTVELIERGCAVARDVGAAIAAVPVKDTIKQVETAHLVERTPNRANLWAAQTPQIFKRSQLLQAYANAGDADVTDDAELLERAGLPVAVYPGSYENIKVTTTEDLWLARAIARQRRRDERAGG